MTFEDCLLRLEQKLQRQLTPEERADYYAQWQQMGTDAAVRLTQRDRAGGK
jgi:hypothetical protein